jgi:DNA-binding response OmpR family regulator
VISTSLRLRELAEAERPVALIIDDDPTARERTATVLRTAGWSVRQARDGEQGLAMAREDMPEVILLDLALPTISGLEVLRTLKGWTDQRTRVIVVSAYATLMQLIDLRLADAAVQKPFDPDELLTQVNWVARRQPAPPVMPWRIAYATT